MIYRRGRKEGGGEERERDGGGRKRGRWKGRLEGVEDVKRRRRDEEVEIKR